MLERDFQRRLINEIKDRFPGSMVLKNDSGYLQGVPDLIVLYGPHWAMLECKASEHASVRPNQKHYVDRLNGMSFARFVCPTNKEEVLNDLQQSFQS